MKLKRIAGGIVIVVVIGVAAAVVLHGQGPSQWPGEISQLVSNIVRGPAQQQAAAAPGELLASGTIEAHTLSVSSPAGGRITTLHVAEGDQVTAGTVIAETDTSIIDAQIAQAQTGVSQAEAQLALLKAGARPQDVDVAAAAVKQAQANAAAAKTAWDDAQALVNAPSALDVKIAGAKAAVKAAEQQVAAAQAGATAADLEEGLWSRTVVQLNNGFDVVLPLPGNPVYHYQPGPDKTNAAQLQWNLSSQKQWQAHAQVGTANAALASAQQNLADLQAQKSDPLSLQAQANAAGAAYQMAEAAVTTAQANLALVQAGPQFEQVRALEAQVQQAREGIQALQVQRDRARVVVPALPLDNGGQSQSGTVTSVVLHEGEVAAPGSPIIHLADLSQVSLTVYVPEPNLGQVRLGQTVHVMVDSFPGRSFTATVTQIANQAEFTPKNVATHDERANTVFAVKLTLANAEALLKPGMPADAYFCPVDGSACPDPARSAATPTPGAGALAQLKTGVTGVLQGGANTAGPIQASGTVEGTEVNVAAELGGKVVQVTAAEGAAVQAGQTLVEIDRREVDAQHAQAQAAVVAAQADLDRVTAAPQAEKVAQAKAQVAQAQAALAAAQSALADAQKLRDNPQDLNAQINGAASQVQAATAQIDVAQAALKQAQVQQASKQPDTGSDQDRTQRAMYDQQVLAAQASLAAAQAQQQGAQDTLDQLKNLRSHPVALDAAVHRGQGQVAQAQAGLDTANAALAQVQAPAQPAAVDLAKAKIAQAQSALTLLDATAARLDVHSPVTGTITAQMIHTGEVAQPGTTLFTVVDLSRVKLLIYVPAGRIGEVKLGQTAQVSVDAFPGRKFTGQVTHINDQAEFTPKNVQTQEERVKTVFQVEIALDNASGDLKPGMPADAVLGK